MLHEDLWLFEDDSYTVFVANKLEDGNYLVTWKTDLDEGDCYYEAEHVLELVSEGGWIVQQEETLK
ncbi:hypothetical protein Kirov_126 [Bacillus phage Kirov]|uniref:Uncharacterized protein n=1 Tax=Bacillus phage Kirov TaxID=2783539 RepID=A0A7U3NJV7_9CAUD|nr:hypothetical protein PQE67_gp178 [Bacillus phage Kirov]QOV08325.1 hypothetical protein Kirov_126 [Bacillus phage Kirov]